MEESKICWKLINDDIVVLGIQKINENNDFMLVQTQKQKLP